MCGIVGYFGNVNKEKLLKMIRTTSHRGPDDSGVYITGNVGLGNNRLAVIDISPKGYQPMFDDRKSVCIVYNGEIYNFMDVRKKLEKEFKFRSNSDTEVIIYAYKKWKTDCLKYLNGMFAFVIYDMDKNLLFGARDRLGEKPLKYFWDGRKFIFASEVKGILSVLKNKPDIDLQAINDYLTLGYVPAPATGFKDIFKLPPASYFVFQEGKLRIYKYWELEFSKKIEISEGEWEDLLEEKIDRAVANRLVSDVPIGSFLSGGIDSSCITAFMAKNSQKRINTFSIGFNEVEYDETRYAKQVSRLYDTIHHVQKVNSKKFGEILSKSADYYDEPFADNSLVPSIILSEFTRKKVTVALSGDGGDENFAGYDRYNIVTFSDYYKRIPNVVRNGFIKPSVNLVRNLFPSLLFLRANTFVQTFDKPFYQKYLYYRSFFGKLEKNDLYSPNIKQQNDTFLHNKKFYNGKLSDLDNALAIDIASYLPEGLLFKMDIASMSVGLEVRSPLLDYKLMELIAQMPNDLKIRGFCKKYILKKMLLRKKILPPEIVNRPKKGFNPPFKKWFKTDMEEFIRLTLEFKKFRSAEIFNLKRLDKYIDDYFKFSIDYDNNIFALISLANWINKYL